jgi:hypothetical protein
MQAKLLVWNECLGEDEHGEHLLELPSWQDIEARLRALDADHYHCLTLYLSPPQGTFPYLTVVGDGAKYAAELELGNEMGERLIYTDLDRYFSFQGQSDYSIGRSYHGWELDETYMTSDIEQILKLAKHFAEQGTWLPNIPHTQI